MDARRQCSLQSARNMLVKLDGAEAEADRLRGQPFAVWPFDEDLSTSRSLRSWPRLRTSERRMMK